MGFERAKMRVDFQKFILAFSVGLGSYAIIKVFIYKKSSVDIYDFFVISLLLGMSISRKNKDE
jgi:uncharacterized membrane protein